MPDDSIRILAVGDVFGKPGKTTLCDRLRSFREAHDIDLCIVNGENAAGGNGITPRIADAFLSSGVDVITLGDHVWDRAEIEEYLQTSDRLLRPENFPRDCPGKGMTIVAAANGSEVAVISLLGRVFMKPSESPFAAIDRILIDNPDKPLLTIVDFHAEATSEKRAMGFFLDGKVTAMVGTHTHVQTADETILPEGTAYITDIGMTGSHDSIIGVEKQDVIRNYRFHLKRKFKPASSDIRMDCVIITAHSRTGKASSIERVQEDFNG